MEIKIMTSSDKQTKIPTFDDISQILDQVAKRLDRVAKRQEETAKQQEEMAKQHKESSKAFDERLEKSRIEFDKDLKRSRLEFDEELKRSRIEFDKRMNKMRGIWSNAWGDFVESLVSGSLVKVLQEWIPSINMIMKNIEGQRNGHDCEFDIIAVNNDALVAVEVKSTLSVNDVKDFLEKLKNFSIFLPQFKGYKVYGAVAYLKVNQDAEKFAIKQGLFVIRATGDSSEILNKKGISEPQPIQQI